MCARARIVPLRKVQNFKHPRKIPRFGELQYGRSRAADSVEFASGSTGRRGAKTQGEEDTSAAKPSAVGVQNKQINKCSIGSFGIGPAIDTQIAKNPSEENFRLVKRSSETRRVGVVSPGMTTVVIETRIDREGAKLREDLRKLCNIEKLALIQRRGGCTNRNRVPVKCTRRVDTLALRRLSEAVHLGPEAGTANGARGEEMSLAWTGACARGFSDLYDRDERPGCRAVGRCGAQREVRECERPRQTMVTEITMPSVSSAGRAQSSQHFLGPSSPTSSTIRARQRRGRTFLRDGIRRVRTRILLRSIRYRRKRELFKWVVMESRIEVQERRTYAECTCASARNRAVDVRRVGARW
ncbi:hypothetical protein B0H19DRAFT_1072153 [Mycena capillaripes]|nr:hypothetical protein B0H19DRAFT_1072153 [Mycena capillaripes]